MKYCRHKKPERWVYENVEVSPYGDTDLELVDVGSESAYVEYGPGRFRCTECGEVGYYTGLWKDFYEKGIPCPGSENVPRSLLHEHSHCSLSVGCDEWGVCYAAAHGEPHRCGKGN